MKPTPRKNEKISLRLSNGSSSREPPMVSKTTLSKKRVIKSVVKKDKPSLARATRTWTVQNMISALDLVHKQKKTMAYAAKKYNIPVSTLRNYTLSKDLENSLYDKKGKNENEFTDDHEDGDANENNETESQEDTDEENDDEEVVVSKNAHRYNTETNGTSRTDKYEESEMDEEVDLDPSSNDLKPAKRKKYEHEQSSNEEISSSDEEAREVFVDSPRTAMAKKSTSPIKFYLNNLLKTQTSESSQSVKSSNHSSTVSNKVASNNIISKPIVPKNPTKGRQNALNETLITPSTFSVIDFIVNNKLLASHNQISQTNSIPSVYNYLSQKSKLIEEFDSK